MFLDDTPIRKKENDLLNRSDFAKKIGQAILNINTENGLCIGLFGPWGSGKTSILHMVLEEIDNETARQETKPIVLSFNPWNFTTEEQLFHQFFYMLANKFSKRKEKTIKETGDVIKKYADLAEEISSLIHFKEFKLGFTSVKVLTNFLSNKSILNDKDLSKQRDIIIDRLREQKQKLIIVIDDIDRLPNSEIRLIFQLVSTVAKFPNTIYLLSFDHHIVVNALSEIQKCDGNNYLEKIVQVPIEIPEIREDLLNKILFAKLDEINNIYKFEFDQNHWKHVYRECLDGQLKTLREINRLINTLHAKCMVAGNELNFADLVGLTFIENKFPKLYYWIKTNKSCLVGDIKFWTNATKDKKKIIEDNEKRILQLFPEQGDLCCRMLRILFPYWGQNGTDSDDVLFRWKRIGHRAIFDRYFCLSLDKDEIPRDIIEKVLFNMDEISLSDFLNGVNDIYSGKYLLNELRASMEELDNERKLLIAKVLIRNGVKFDDDRERFSQFGITTFDELDFQISNLLRGIKDENLVFELLYNEIINVDKNTIRIISRLINSIVIFYGKQSENGDPLITEEHLLQCEPCYCDGVKTIAENTDLFELTDAHLILYLFEKFDQKGFEQYIQKALNNDLETLKFLQTFASKAYGSDGSICWYYENGYRKFLSVEKINNAYDECLSNGRFWTLSNEVQLRIIAFELWIKKQRTWAGGVSNDLAIKRQTELKGIYTK